MEERALALGEIAWDVLRRIVRDLVARKPGGHLIESQIEQVELNVLLALRGPGATPREFSEQLVAAVDRILDDFVEHAAAFRPGHAYCHRCSSSSCEHSQPPSGRHVFLGYGPTGTPRFEDFAQACLDRHHPEVDRLYDDPPAFLTAVVKAPELRSDLLRAFDSGAYELLGQVVAGFFSVPARCYEGRAIFALTFQVAASRGRAGRVRHGLNILGRAPGGEDLATLWDRQDDLPWRPAVAWGQAALATLDRGPGRRGGNARVEPSRADLERRVGGILAGIARRLEKDVRARGRRTQHAQERHDSGERPTRMARADARTASAASVLIDERNGTVVVLGERGRAHFFTRDGRLVSSVRYGRDAIERKRKLGLWRAATAEEARAFRGATTGDPAPAASGGPEQV